MPPRFLEANPRVWEDSGKVALMRGPLVYCLEGVDNPYTLSDIRLSKDCEYTVELDSQLGFPVLSAKGFVRKWNEDELYAEEKAEMQVPVRLIPYFTFANRGATDLIIWTRKQ